jgi:SAM-dependent methyltransferase
MSNLDSTKDKHERGYPSTKDDLKDLILKSLDTDYVSESCKDSIQTGNHYQSLTLGDVRTTGFRTDREEFLDQINFQGKKVLDLGSNLGEISRVARTRGAYLVDGFEYDQYFLEIANLVNAYNNVTRVSFYQRDITDPSVYTEHYDIVLAFSVFTYVHSALEQIAAITNQLFILETHKLEGNFDSDYLRPVLQYFPYCKILGESEWGAKFDASEKRAVVAFAKDAWAFAATLHRPLV